MSARKISNRYSPKASEDKWHRFWDEEHIYDFSREDTRPVYTIDTPPPTVSGDLTLGHCYSYSQPDFMARFYRMNGHNVYYPMGWDDNGLPTERLVERRLGIKPEQEGRARFIQAIIEVSRDLEEDYERLWRRLGLSVDWSYVYSTISPQAQKISQYSFIDLYNKRLAYRASSPAIWCPTCRTAIAQAEVNDLERETKFVTVAFRLADGQTLPIATTRPELLPACVAVLVNPSDQRHAQLIGRTAITPLFNQEVPIIADRKADPEKGTGVVMVCTFGDTLDVEWWREHNLPLISIIRRDGKLNEQSGPYAELSAPAARSRIIADLMDRGLLFDQKPISHTVRVHERCDTPVEYIETKQWFVKLLERKNDFIEAGRQIKWHPTYMHARYEDWVTSLSWDWCISRQRYFGVPFPVWYCTACGEPVLADPIQLPVDPSTQQPSRPCQCGSTEAEAETDVMDTWATSSVSPQIASRWLEDGQFFDKVFPMSLRPQAHDIIRTWTFYTIVKSLYHSNQLPWSNVAISGHGLAPDGVKISKSRGGGPLDPTEMMDRYSADSVRYWAASTKIGRDSIISEEKIASGQKLVTKLWNVARFTIGFLDGYQPPATTPDLLPSDHWILSRLQHLIERATDGFEEIDYTMAKDEVEAFFWNVLADNYLEMVKARLYELPDGNPQKESARYSLYSALLSIIKLLAPIMPYIAEEIFQLYFVQHEETRSIHTSKWPEVKPVLVSSSAETLGDALVALTTEVRRYKSRNKLPMGTQLPRLQIAASHQELLSDLAACAMDIKSVTRAQDLAFSDTPAPSAVAVPGFAGLWIAIEESY